MHVSVSVWYSVMHVYSMNWGRILCSPAQGKHVLDNVDMYS